MLFFASVYLSFLSTLLLPASHSAESHDQKTVIGNKERTNENAFHPVFMHPPKAMETVIDAEDKCMFLTKSSSRLHPFLYSRFLQGVKNRSTNQSNLLFLFALHLISLSLSLPTLASSPISFPPQHAVPDSLSCNPLLLISAFIMDEFYYKSIHCSFPLLTVRPLSCSLLISVTVNLPQDKKDTPSLLGQHDGDARDRGKKTSCALLIKKEEKKLNAFPLVENET